jgi:hypothetical protein
LILASSIRASIPNCLEISADSFSASERSLKLLKTTEPGLAKTLAEQINKQTTRRNRENNNKGNLHSKKGREI